jgi:outer membrane protein OmpA-like peptidoglycan-associated protein/tetratricopeptide (TPR) repeat protein
VFWAKDFEMTMKRFLLTLTLCCLIGSLFAQRKSINYGDVYFESFEYKLAIRAYKEAIPKLKDSSQKQYVYAQISRCYANLFQYLDAEEYFELMLKEEGEENVQPDLFLEYGNLLKVNGKYEEAKLQYEKYKHITQNKDADQLIQSVNWAMKTENRVSDHYRVFLTDLDISGQSLGYCYYGKGLIYCHGRNKPRFGEGKQVIFDIDYAISENNLEFVGRNNFFPQLSFKLNELSPSISRDETQLYFSANATRLKDGVPDQKSLVSDQDGVTNLKLYVSTKQDASFQNIKELPFNSSRYSCIHPCILADGVTLVFSSDMPGGYGGFDLYKVSLSKDSIWGSPVNMGPEVNTKENELFPWVSGNLIFFASKGFNGYGGYDIYVAQLDDQMIPSDLKNMGLPLNSFRDDVAFISNDSGATGYFSSNRDREDGADQVYFFRESRPGKVSVRLVSGNLEDNEIKMEMPDSMGSLGFINAKVEDHQPQNAPAASLGLVNTGQTPPQVKPAKAETKSVAIAAPVAKESTAGNVAVAAPVPKKSKAGSVAEVVSKPKVPATNNTVVTKTKKYPPILFKLNDATLSPSQIKSADSAVVMLKRYPKLVVSISAYTDSRGRSSYNLMLSNKRANVVKQYMMSKGIPANRITTKGFGETQLLNGCADGVVCSEKQHAINRRVEMVVSETE